MFTLEWKSWLTTRILVATTASRPMIMWDTVYYSLIIEVMIHPRFRNEHSYHLYLYSAAICASDWVCAC
jgi:hypothetical protein